MAKKKKNEYQGDDPKEYVLAVLANDHDEAVYYRDLLNDRDIPAVIGPPATGQDDDEPVGEGVPVLVPEAYLDEASELIAEGEGLDAFEDEDDELLDDDGEDPIDEYLDHDEE